MKRLWTATALLLLLTGCGNDIPSTKKAKGEQLIVFRCGEGFFGTDRWCDVLTNSESLLQMGDGEFAMVTADVTYITGGESGFQNVPKIDHLIEMTPISLGQVKAVYDVAELTEKPEQVAWQLYLWEHEDAEYYLFFHSGDGYLYQDGERLGVFEKLYQEENVLEFLESVFEK